MMKTRWSFYTLASSSILALALGAGPVFADSWGSSGCGSTGGGFLHHGGGGCFSGCTSRWCSRCSSDCTSGGFIKLHLGCGSARGGGTAAPSTGPRSPLNPNIPASGSELYRGGGTIGGGYAAQHDDSRHARCDAEYWAAFPMNPNIPASGAELYR